MASSIQILRSTTTKERPFPGSLLEGQPAVNVNAIEPGLFFKASDGTLIKIGPAAITSDGTPPNTGGVGQQGNCPGELWLDKSMSAPVLKVYDGAQWAIVGGQGGGPIDGALILDNTVTGTKLVDEAVTSDKLAVGSVTSSTILDGTIENIDVSDAAAIASSKLEFLHSGSNSVARTIQSKLSDTYSVKDFGAEGDGIQDDRQYIINTIVAARNNGGGTVYFPPGTYRITDRISVGSGTNTPTRDIALVGSSAVISADPSGPFLNYAIQLSGVWRSIIVDGLTILGNNKMSTGIRISSTVPGQRSLLQLVNNCEVRDIRGIDVPTNVFPNQGFVLGASINAVVANSRVENVTRDAFGPSGVNTGACQAIVVVACDNVWVQNNFVKNVSHGYQGLADADGIVVFSTNTSSYYSRETAVIAGNTITDCLGRCVKLQTNGECLVQGNTLRLDTSEQVINAWCGIDSQVANADIRENTFYIGNAWTGGVTASAVVLGRPLSVSAIAYPFEGFRCTVENNFLEVRKPLRALFTPFAPVVGVDSNVYHCVRNNTANAGGSFGSANYAAEYAVWVRQPQLPANAKNYFVEVSNNTISTQRLVTIDTIGGGSLTGDYADKYYFKIFGNTNLSQVDDIVVHNPGPGFIYSSTSFIKDNQLGSSAGNRINWPVNLTKIFSGSDWQSSTQTISNAPPSSTNSRFYRQGGIWGVQTPTAMYSSSNGTTWNLL